MRKLLLLTLLVFALTESRAQVPAQWNRVDSIVHALGIELSVDGESLIVWGMSSDTICFETAASVVVIDTSGNIYKDTVYELNYCQDEMPKALSPNRSGDGYFLITENSMPPFGDSSFVYYLDSNLVMQWSLYVGRAVRSGIEPYENQNYIGSDNNSQVRQVLRFDDQAMLDTLNAVTLPYLNWAPRVLLGTNGLILEVGSWPNFDSAFVCLVYDTAGNYVNDFSFDADSNEDEVPLFFGLNDNLLFHVSGNSPNTYAACTDLNGVTQWIDTLYHSLNSSNGACIDTINDIGFVFCRTPTGRIFSYDLNTGMLLDSILVDSVNNSNAGIRSGPAGGVYLMQRNWPGVSIVVKQYDAGLNLIWTGYVDDTACTNPCYPEDFLIDSLGYIYTVSNCSGCGALVSKFGPSLVSVPSNEPINANIKLFPSPANTEVTIAISDENCVGGDITVIDATGKILKSNSFFGNSYSLPTEEFSSGLYFIEVTTDSGQRFTQKLIIQHP